MIKVIVFDFWSTIGYKRHKKWRAKLLWKETGKKCSYRKFDKTFEKHFQLDKSSDYEKKYKNMLKELKISCPDNVIKEYAFHRKKIESKRFIFIYTYVLPLLKELKKNNYKISILSNTTYMRGSKISKSKLKKYVDKFFFSYDIGSIKPDLKNFKYILSYFKVKPSESLMIGDSYKDDILPARNLGMKTIHFQNERQLRKKLKKIGVL